jgi:transcriptional regulator with XRE-family HTH domain
MAILGSRAHEALVAVLVMARDSTGMTQREVVDRLPDWLRFSQTTLAKIETGRRAAAFEEVQALAEVYDTDIATIEAQAAAYLAAMGHSVTSKPLTIPSVLRKKKRSSESGRRYGSRGTGGGGGG